MLANDVLTPEEAAEFLKLNVRTVTDYIREGVIPARKIGRFWRLSRHCLEEWLGAGDDLPYTLRAAFDQARDEAARGQCCTLDDYLAQRQPNDGARHVPRDLAEAGGAAAR